MGRTNRKNAERLVDGELHQQLEEKRAYVALLNEKGRSGTVHHEALARLEALVAGTALPSEDFMFMPFEAADQTQVEEDSDNG